MATWPERGQKAPDFWDQMVKDYIDEADTANADATAEAQADATAAQQAAQAAGSTASSAGAEIDAHVADKANPHEVTKAQVGLSNVDNTSDANKPVSTAQAAALGLKADVLSPVFSGNPTAPTPVSSDNDTSIATTAFVKAQGYAPLASPALTGNPTVPTQSSGDNSTRAASTAFVKAQGYAPSVSPAFTGTPLAPTQTSDDNSTRLATTAFVKAASSPLVAQGVELRESFTGMSDGAAPALAATRQSMTNFQFYAGAAPYIRSGFLTTQTPGSAQAGSYRIAQLSGPVVRCGARFAFTPYTNAGGLMCLSIQASSIATKSEGQVPVSPMHLQITPTTWSLDVNDTDNTAVETVASGTFDTALVADGTTLHSVDVILDRDKSQCYVTFPSGMTVVFTDSRFSLPGTYVYVEPFKTAGSLSTKTDALIKEWWADSRAIEEIVEARAANASTPWQAVTFSGAWANAGGANQTVQIRKQGDKVKGRGVAAGGVIGTSVFSLPPNWRPKAARQFGTVSNSAFGAFVINTDGTVVVYVGNNAYVGLEFEIETTGAGTV